jgi:hypothetical protein
MRVVKLLSWAADVSEKAALLKLPRVAVDAAPLVRTSAVVGELAGLDPAVLVLDMDKRPSNAREIALMLRASKSARHIPILLAGGLPSRDGIPEKFARLREELPDLPYAAWPEAACAAARLIESPSTAHPLVAPERVYTASLAQKLGVLPGTGKTAAKQRCIALVGAPEGFVELLGELPTTVRFITRIAAGTNLAICFIRSLRDLEALLEMLGARLPERASAWIVYPKKNARRGEPFKENDIRRSGLEVGFVDYKICSVDAAWSGMKFARRKIS